MFDKYPEWRSIWNLYKKTYKAWNSMKSRCYTGGIASRYHGERGIKVCRKWRRSFRNFVDDMGIKPIGMSLDRIDNDGNYTPGNCRWATPYEQVRNRRNTRLLTHQGETMTIEEWSRRTGRAPKTIKRRLKIGWDVAAALTTRPYSRRAKNGTGIKV